MFYPRIKFPINQQQNYREHNERLQANVPVILQSAEQALQELTRFLASP
jgi:hypothetical protein